MTSLLAAILALPPSQQGPIAVVVIIVAYGAIRPWLKFGEAMDAQAALARAQIQQIEAQAALARAAKS